MRIEVETNLPRHFPPGYFRDRWFVICAAMNVGMLVYDVWACAINVGRDVWLAIAAGAFAMQICTTARFLRSLWKHHRQWVNHDRPALINQAIELARLRVEHERFIEHLRRKYDEAESHDRPR